MQRLHMDLGGSDPLAEVLKKNVFNKDASITHSVKNRSSELNLQN